MNEEEKLDLFKKMIEKRKKYGLTYKTISEIYGLQQHGFYELKRFIQKKASEGNPMANDLLNKL